jgi:hypothetical protein
VLFRTFSRAEYFRQQYSFLVLRAKDVYGAPAEAGDGDQTRTASIKPVNIPEVLTSRIFSALGILPDGRLVFIDCQHWIYTTQLPSPAEEPETCPRNPETVFRTRRHFFLPQDWVTGERVLFCRLLRDGTVLCPKGGEVAISKGDLVRDC